MFRDPLVATQGRKRPSDDVGPFASDLFLDAYEYYRRYPDVTASLARARDHFLCGGEAERRIASDRFDGGDYVARYPDVATFTPGPLSHWLNYGSLQPLAFEPIEAGLRLAPSDRLREAMHPTPGGAASPASLWFDDVRWAALASAAEAPAWIGRAPMPNELRWLPETSPGNRWALGRGERLYLERMGLFDPPAPLSLVPPRSRSGPAGASEAFSLHILTTVSQIDTLLDLCAAGVDRAMRAAGLSSNHVRWTLFVANATERRRHLAALPPRIRRFATIRIGTFAQAELRRAALSGRSSWVLPLATSQILLSEALAVLSHYAENTGAAFIAAPPVLTDDDGRVLSYARFDRAPSAMLGRNAGQALRCWRRTLLEVEGGERMFEPDYAWMQLADDDICAPAEHLHMQPVSMRSLMRGPELAAAAAELDCRFGPLDLDKVFPNSEVGCLISADGVDTDAVAGTVKALRAAGEPLRRVSASDAQSALPALLALMPGGTRPTPAFVALARAQAASGAQVVFGRTVVRQANGELARGPELVPPAALLVGARIPAAACLFTRDCLDRIGPGALSQLLAAGDAAPTLLIKGASHWLALDICVAEIPEGAERNTVLIEPPILSIAHVRRLSRFPQTYLYRLDPSLIERLQSRIERDG